MDAMIVYLAFNYFDYYFRGTISTKMCPTIAINESIFIKAIIAYVFIIHITTKRRFLVTVVTTYLHFSTIASIASVLEITTNASITIVVVAINTFIIADN
eukprot:5991826-Ditylum_brightwellii.AAC.1